MTDERDLERDLAAALDRAAARAPLDAPEWIEPTASPGAPTSTTRVLGAAAVVAALVAGTTALVVTRVDNDPAVRSVASEPAEPEGTEVPLEPVPASDDLRRTISVQPVKPGSVASATVADQSATVYTTVTWTGIVGEPVQDLYCIDAGFGACISGNIDETHPTDVNGWILWHQVPADLAYVSVELDGEIFWQRPYAGLVAIPGRRNATYRMTAVSVDGEETVVAEHVADAPTSTPVEDSLPFETRPLAETNELANLVLDSVSQCLDEAGLGDPLAPTPSGVDADAEWDNCLAEAQALVDAQLTEPAPPDGTEVPLESAPTPEDSELLRGSYAWPFKPGSVATVRLGDNVFETYVEMLWTGVQGSPVTSQQCVIGSAIEVSPCVRVASGEPRVFRDGTFIIFPDVPANVAYVEVTMGDELFWQRPVHGVMVMPDRPDVEPGIQVISADGSRATVKYLLNEEESVAGTAEPEIVPAHLTQEVHAAASLTARECIEDAGFDDPTGPIPAGVDVDEIWDACLHEADSAAADMLDPPLPEGTEPPPPEDTEVDSTRST